MVLLDDTRKTVAAHTEQTQAHTNDIYYISILSM